MRICEVPWILGAFSSLTSAQIQVMAPKDLLEFFNESKGFLPGSTAAFGTPYYGERIFGGLLYGKPKDPQRPHCVEEDYHVLKATAVMKGLAPIIVVDRGGCSFVTKVREAESKGAKAVIIVDDESHPQRTREEVQYIVMADDGWGANIRIPSILVCRADGEAIISTILRYQNDLEPPVVELNWAIQQRPVAKMDLWTSPGVFTGVHFLAEYASHARSLGSDMHFQPHYHAVSLGLKADDNKLCIDGRMDLCTEDPDQSGPVTGEDVLYESVRQYCIWELTQDVQTISDAGYARQYSRRFWDYVELLSTECPLGDVSHGYLGQICSEKVMNMVGIDTGLIQTCIDKRKYTILEHERDNHAWNVLALRINDWRYSGPLSPDIITRAICSSFVSAPDSCRKILSDTKAKHDTDADSDSSMLRVFSYKVGKVGFISALLGVIPFLCCCGVIARKIIIRNTRENMRYEVMNEVKGQIRASRSGTSSI
eukprot:gnl/MRDRNA2_/MRDRNA2_125455_c0_seq1.p1 gnl/MRDRNA2_/MRDRNA2_125455_c0~~gnl/MRDRNA2_/MRDRNA2_125455_c0_seq1.p1  ORF type:complete len:483 (+),score=61.76 gnl/MRDRNA2_/MRDRNA2_125455_c0_seq1:77-1525(+)